MAKGDREYTVYVSTENVDGSESELEVTGRVSAYMPAVTYGASDLWSPAEGGDVEIVSVSDEDGNDLDVDEFSEEALARMSEALLEAAYDDDGEDESEPEYA